MRQTWEALTSWEEPAPEEDIATEAGAPLHIPHVPEKVIAELGARGWNTPEALSEVTDEALREVAGLGPKTLGAIRSWAQGEPAEGGE